MTASAVVTFLTVFSLALVNAGGHGNPRKAVDVSSAPWHVALFVNNVYVCSGSIISDQWILSAAHCTIHRESLPMMVRVGSNDHASGGQIYSVEKAVSHGDYETNGNNDISVLKTTKPMVLGKTVNKVPLPDKGAASPIPTGTMLHEFSWRRPSKSNATDPNMKLTRAEIRTLEFSMCKEKFQPFHPDGSLQLCATANDREACSEDSGGSLVRGEVLVGVTSYGDEVCGHAPGVYTKVSAFRDWITNNTGL